MDQFVEAPADYRGAILVVSQDYSFLRRNGIDAVVELGADGRMRRRSSL